MKISDITVFAAISSSGSLSAAARKLGATPMIVSRRLAFLERQLGVRLFHRSTRALSLTPEGKAFLPYVQTMLEAHESARAVLTPDNVKVSGVLKVTATAVFGQSVIMPLIPRLLASHPQLQVDLTFTDDIIDIVRMGMDVAVRIGSLSDSELVARRLADNPRILCATPAYLVAHGPPRSLEDLTNHSCLILKGRYYWPFIERGQARSIRVGGNFTASSVESVRSACLQGLGLALLTYWDVRPYLIDGSLVNIELVDAQPDGLPIWAISPTRQYTPLRVSLFLDMLERALNE